MEKVGKKNGQASSPYIESQCRMCHKTVLEYKDTDPLRTFCSDECSSRFAEFHNENHWN